jgi:hypothetical protein
MLDGEDGSVPILCLWPRLAIVSYLSRLVDSAEEISNAVDPNKEIFVFAMNKSRPAPQTGVYKADSIKVFSFNPSLPL